MSDFAELLKEYSAAFDKLTQERHEVGAKEYGAFTFLENDVVRMMMEELADTANYCRMQFIKLMLLQHALEEEIGQGLHGATNQEDNITIGVKSFKGAGDIGWN